MWGSVGMFKKGMALVVGVWRVAEDGDCWCWGGGGGRVI